MVGNGWLAKREIGLEDASDMGADGMELTTLRINKEMFEGVVVVGGRGSDMMGSINIAGEGRRDGGLGSSVVPFDKIGGVKMIVLNAGVSTGDEENGEEGEADEILCCFSLSMDFSDELDTSDDVDLCRLLLSDGFCTL